MTLLQRSAVSAGGVRKVRSGAHVVHACSASAGAAHAQQRDSSRMGSWSAAQKVELVRLVREHNPCGAADWEVRSPCSFPGAPRLEPYCCACSSKLAVPAQSVPRSGSYPEPNQSALRRLLQAAGGPVDTGKISDP